MLRYFILASHYRSALNYSDQNLDTARQALTRLYTALRGLSAAENLPEDNSYRQRFHQVMQDDFNTPEALAILFELAHEINKHRATDLAHAQKLAKHRATDLAHAQKLAGELRSLAAMLGLLQTDSETFLQGETIGLSAATIENMIQQRNEARAAKNWKESDRIRDELKAQGVVLEDGAQGTTWRKI